MTIHEHLELLRIRLEAVEQWEADTRQANQAKWKPEHWWMNGQLNASLITAMEATNRVAFWAKQVAEVSKTAEGDKA